MHGNLEPEEHLFDESPSDLWDDMDKLTLLSRIDVDNEDVLQFSADFAKDCIIITNKSRKKN